MSKKKQRPSFDKRRREREKQLKRQEKLERRIIRKEEKEREEANPTGEAGEDPDSNPAEDGLEGELRELPEEPRPQTT